MQRREMQVREIMSSPAITVTPETEIRDVARIMRENLFSGVPVVDEQDGLLGIITEMDLIARNAPLQRPQYIAVLSAMIPVNIAEVRQYREQLRQVLATTAGDLMQEEVETVSPETPIEEALEAMLDPEVTMLPVMEGETVVGVVTRTDLVRLIEQLEMAPDEESNT
jgi:CBS domain-containing protein